MAAEGVTVIVCSMAETVRLAEPTIVPDEACMKVVPDASPEASPAELTLATPELVDFQVTKAVMFEVIPPLNVPIAVNCCCIPVLMAAEAGVTAIADSPVSVPVPLRGTVCGELAALSVTVRMPVRVPSALGVKLTEIVHPLSLASVCGAIGQLVVCAKSPVTLIEEMVRGPDWWFFRVTVCAALLVLTI